MTALQIVLTAHIHFDSGISTDVEDSECHAKIKDSSAYYLEAILLIA